ncbi:hypothetical protein P691DRAFT_53677 [Macrolepiota fuliginosa MF-IS2]|uniref:YEATS domain-containing protein n=1 Tax=Macrolepiota fuliginosa MF-IS2 TaxID=1400762 RepID=A0A9P6C4D5_9AGAR|nr:hypothetical protein P691DRAFT_53677 [Macrolepiota fuliginosa MF-IS2]
MISDEDQQPDWDRELLSQTTASEFNLEIGLRERITQTLNARIAWATLLKESLQEGVRTHAVAPESFKYAAFDALKTSERPSDILHDREELAPPNLSLQEALRNARPAPKPKLQLPRNPKTAFLFIRSQSLLGTGRRDDLESELCVLKCPVCSRITFTSLQGLLNHARISHSLEWGTHDECIHACAVADPDIDIDTGIEVGVGSGGILPGLRTIFEMAVGPSRSNARIGARSVVEDEKSIEAEYHASSPSYLTKTLGLHGDTPALAPFLGKAPIRRGINVCQQDETLDIGSASGASHAIRPKAWRLQLAQRGSLRLMVEEGGINVNGSGMREEDHTPGLDHIANDVPRNEGNTSSEQMLGPVTRFHFATRIVVTDRSLWIDPGMWSILNFVANGFINDYQAKGRHSPINGCWHWTLLHTRVSFFLAFLPVLTPLQAHDLTAILRSMKVTPLVSPDIVECRRPVVEQYPYVVVGLASEAFLAKVELVFNEIGSDYTSGEREGQPFSIEHWVELDPLKSSAAVVGEEQIYDVELDKRTAVRTVSSERPPLNLKALWKLANEFRFDEQEPKMKDDDTPRLAYEVVLKDLLPRFPLTFRDLKRKRASNPVPYRLVASETQFSNLIQGRRQAIEWGRARAIRDAYNEIVQRRGSSDLFLLTAADVHAWLREGGHSHKGGQVQATPSLEKIEMVPTRESQSHWCSLCGLENAAHSLRAPRHVKYEDHVMQDENGTAVGHTTCVIAAQDPIAIKLRPFNVERLRRSSPSPPARAPTWKPLKGFQHLNTKAVTRLADPRLTLALRQMIRPLNYSSFECRSRCISTFPLDHLGQSPDEIEASLAPYATLAVCLRPFIRRIVLSGLDIAKHQKASLTVIRKSSKKGAQDCDSDVSLLTPTHILTGIRSRGRRGVSNSDSADEAILLCLSSLGTVLGSRRENDDREGAITVKTEQP